MGPLRGLKGFRNDPPGSDKGYLIRVRQKELSEAVAGSLRPLKADTFRSGGLLQRGIPHGGPSHNEDPRALPGGNHGPGNDVRERRSQMNGRPGMKGRSFLIPEAQPGLQDFREAEHEVPFATDGIFLAQRESVTGEPSRQTQQHRVGGSRPRSFASRLPRTQRIFLHAFEPIMTTAVYWPGRFIAADRKNK